MALDFPNTPSLNQVFTASGSTWIWNGKAWLKQIVNSDKLDDIGDVVAATPSLNDVLIYNGTSWINTKTTTSLVNNGATVNIGAINSGNITGSVLDRVQENWNVSSAAAGGSVNLDVNTAAAWYYTGNASSNWTLNIRGSSATPLNNILDVGDSISVVFAANQGSTPYYVTNYAIDGVAATPRWQGALAPTSGNSTSTDVYALTLIKTAPGATPSYTILGSQTQFK